MTKKQLKYIEFIREQLFLSLNMGVKPLITLNKELYKDITNEEVLKELNLNEEQVFDIWRL